MAKPVVITAGGASSPSRKKLSLANGDGKRIADEKSPDKAAGSSSPIKSAENKNPNINLEIPDHSLERSRAKSIEEEGLSYDDEDDFDEGGHVHRVPSDRRSSSAPRTSSCST